MDDEHGRLVKIINQLLSKMNNKVRFIEEIIEKDRLKHTASGNGVQIRQEEVLCDFLNNRSGKLKAIIK